MEKPSKKIESFTGNLIKEAGLQQPSVDFFANVMNAVEIEKIQKPIVYQSLISKQTWIILLVASVIVTGLLFIFPSSSETIVNLPNLNFEKLLFQLPELHFSKITIYGIGFLGLFLVQIPFLKRQLNKSY
ncbi:MAG: hypothetical protein L3J09_08250 [Flavobacteriaceae bacterium]|nr:hypothetical protein [Flavobacteriaceae bacterium]